MNGRSSKNYEERTGRVLAISSLGKPSGTPCTYRVTEPRYNIHLELCFIRYLFSFRKGSEGHFNRAPDGDTGRLAKQGRAPGERRPSTGRAIGSPLGLRLTCRVVKVGGNACLLGSLRTALLGAALLYHALGISGPGSLYGGAAKRGVRPSTTSY